MKVLVIKIAAMGDFLMATPALRALKQSGRVTELLLLAGESIQPVVERCPSIDRVIYLNDRIIFHGSSRQKAGEVLRISRILRKEKISTGFNFHRDWRYNLILFLSGIPQRIGFARKTNLFLTRPVSVPGIKHHIFHYCDLLKPLEIPCFDFRMEFELTEEEIQKVRQEIREILGTGDFIAVAPGGAVNIKERMISRRWPPSCFARLVELLGKQGMKTVLVGGGEDREAAAVIAGRNPGVVDLTGKTTVAEAAALFRLARASVANDSGLMHLAAAMKTPVVSLFGPTHPEEKRPLIEGSKALWKGEKIECSPCYREGNFPECLRLECLEAITPQEVATAISRILQSTSGTRK